MKKTIIVLLLLFYPASLHAMTIGVIADIHAGGEKGRNLGKISGLYPRNYKRNLNTLKLRRPDIIVTAGDITNASKKKYYKDVKKQLKKFPVLWVKGNHDRTKDWKKRIIKKRYYCYNFNGVKFIALDTTQFDPGGLGALDAAQLNWLREQLKTDLPVVISMHHPPFYYQGLDSYVDFRQIVREAGNVRAIFFGHKHTENICENIDGTDYCSTKALSLASHEGNYRLYNINVGDSQN